MSCGQDNRGALHTFSISFAFAYSQVRSSTMSKQSLEEAVKLRNTAAYNLKVSVLSKSSGRIAMQTRSTSTCILLLFVMVHVWVVSGCGRDATGSVDETPLHHHLVCL